MVLDNHDSTPAKTQPEAAYTLPTITLVMEPGGAGQTRRRPKTVKRLLSDLNIRPGTALVIRNGELLTHDRSIETDDTIIVRTVVSGG